MARSFPRDKRAKLFYRGCNPCESPQYCAKFAHTRLRPLDLDNLSRCEIPQHINGAWFGWHAFRRGLGTRLNEMEVPDKGIQNILRHADISTTQAYYILPNMKRAKAGLKKLGTVAQRKYSIKV